MDAMHYETFIRRAFGNHNRFEGRMLSRCGDPAELADTSSFSLAANSPVHLAQIKAAAVYSISILQTRLEKDGNLGNYSQHIDDAILAACAATSQQKLVEIISDFVEKVEFAAFPPHK